VPPEDLALLRREPGGGEQIRSLHRGSPQRLLAPPAGDRLVVAGEEDLRHGEATELGRARVLRVLEQAAAEGFLARRLFVAENTGDEAADGVDDDEGGDLTAGKNEVADRDLISSSTKRRTRSSTPS
jgi:hypothetical protein